MSDKIRFIYLIKPISHLIPNVPLPKYKVKTSEKIVWTSIVLFIFLVCSQIPLYGTYKTANSDPLHYMRVISASSHGSLMELGTTPAFTSSTVLSMLALFKVIEVDREIEEDRILYEQCEKLFAILISLGEAIAYVCVGSYGEIEKIGLVNCILLITQLTFAGIMVIVLDDLLSKGYGLVSGISLFVATNISENIMWKSFSPFTVTSEKGIEYEGAIIALFHLLMTHKNKKEALKRAFFRHRSPNLCNLISTVIIVLIVIYLRFFRVEIKVNSRRLPGEYIVKKIKLFYCSTTPIILLNAALSNVYNISEILYKRYKQFFIIRLIGEWKEKGGVYVPTGGLAYYISPPQNFADFLTNPIKSVIYVLFILTASGIFARTVVDMSEKSPRALARSFKSNGFFLEGLRENEESIYRKFEKIIPAVAALGGIVTGALQIIADLSNAIGSGTGILLLVGIILEIGSTTTEKDENGKVKKKVSTLLE